ncbi:hypothetical protein NEOLEDRAFT_579528 [Neolentinus lepideus HHB14362 ss-1]|uniref:Fungal-type protein kinase domain-containing protein n=1 Tax=Neolentinus lepideus HHB14362 ss-1 TaxID=1314782 RepID=A0A165QXV3_9AGAM|nr:hypothetical protein NEOLEDRAFT_579528 [Neolentinus lepideus HHB14362 ss-1]
MRTSSNCRNGLKSSLSVHSSYSCLAVETERAIEENLNRLFEALLNNAVALCNSNRTKAIGDKEDAFSKTDGASPKEERMNELQALLFDLRQVPDERGRYKPFCSLTNKILETLPQTAGTSEMGLRSPCDKGDRLIFQRSDPMQIRTPHMGIDRLLLSSPTIRVPDVVGLTHRDALLTTQGKESKLVPEVTDLSWQKHAFEAALSPPKSAPTFRKLRVGLEFKRIKRSMDVIPCEFSTELQEEPARDVAEDIAQDVAEDMNESPGGGGNVKGFGKRKSETQEGKPAKKAKASNRVEELSPSGSRTLYHLSHEKDPASESPTKKQPPNVQVALYAAERLSSSVTINHSLQLVIVDGTIWLWWFDRGGAIQSCGMNFITHLPYFVLLLDILRRFDEHAWGVNRVFKKTDVADTFEVVLHGPGPEPAEVTVTLNALTHMHLHLFNRGTTVVPATSEDPSLPGNDMVAKIYHPDEQRENEINILAEVYKVAAGEAENAKRVYGHVPVLLASRDWEDEYGEQIERILGISRREGKRRFRSLRVMLFRRLRPISELSGKEFMKAFRDCFLCHGVLWMNNIHHRDISENNLMYTRVNGVVVGVLNDFDLSIIHSDDRLLASERTGTIPFMAHALLRDFNTGKKVPHIYEYDVESFAYVGLWISARYDEGKIANHEAYRPWTHPISPHHIGGDKRTDLTESSQCIQQAALRSSAPVLPEDEVNVGGPQSRPQESPKAYFDRLSTIIHTKALPPEYHKYFEEGDKVINEWKGIDALSQWYIRPGLP